MAIYSIDQILLKIIDWEKSMLVSLEKISEFDFDDTQFKNVFPLMRDSQLKMVNFLKQFTVSEFKKIEFLKNVQNYDIEPPIHNVNISTHESTVDLISKVIFILEDMLKEYKHLSELATFDQSKELFRMLVQMKTGQIKKIKGMLDCFS